MDEPGVRLRGKVTIAVVLCMVLVGAVSYAVARHSLADREALAQFLLLSTLAFGATGALILFIVARSFEPLERITAAARRLGEGAEDLALSVESADEMQVLAEALNDSARRLAVARRDLAAQNRMLVQAEKMAAMGQLTAGVAHEVNNPLAYILTNEAMTLHDLEELAADERLPAEARATLQEACEDVRVNLDGLQHIKRIVRSLRDFARPSSQERGTSDVADVARSAAVLAGERAKRHDAEVELDLPPEPLRAHVAKDEVGQVVLNLLLNAIDATGMGGHVVVQGAREDGHVVLRVRDDGPGIPAEVQAKLFTPFFTTKKEGVGLGLSISRRIAEDHGGTLTFTSAPGRGTEFALRLPAAPDAAPLAEPPAPR
ncbi:MAG TPA: ATP-binding protein [Candidatus Thermoplasmatota archaeon]|jgi:signal transduction histidine kinase|nr:ATP-binding protein [Candidatus Thermoplasmatota archaeon]